MLTPRESLLRKFLSKGLLFFKRLTEQKSNIPELKSSDARSLNCNAASDVLFTDSARIRNNRGMSQFITIGKETVIAGELLTFGHSGRITIGYHCFLGEGSRVWSANNVFIGNRVLISHNVNIMDTDSHPIDPHERNQHFLHVMRKGHPADSANMKNVASEPVIIGDDCWISFGVTILKGVSIGPRSVIGAGAIVTSDVPQDSLYFNRVRPVITPIQSRFQQPQSFHEDY